MLRRILSIAVVSVCLVVSPGKTQAQAQGTGVGDAAAAAGVVVEVIGGLSTWIAGIQSECAAAGLGAAWGKDCGLKQEECTDTGIFYATCSATASNACGWGIGGGYAWENIYGMWSGYGVDPWAYCGAMPLHGNCDSHSAKAWGKASVDGTSRASTVDTTGASVMVSSAPSPVPAPGRVWPPGTVLVVAKIDTLVITRSAASAGSNRFKGNLRVNGAPVWSVTASVNQTGAVTTTGPLSASQFSVTQTAGGDWKATLIGYRFEHPVDTLYVPPPGAPGVLGSLSSGGDTSTDVSVSMDTEVDADASLGADAVCTGPTVTTCGECYSLNGDGTYTYVGQNVTISQPVTVLTSSLNAVILDTYVSDATGTIHILDPFQGPGTWKEGDVVHVSGEVTLFEGDLVMTDVQITRTGVQPVPKPILTTPRELFDRLGDLDGSLVTVTGLTLVNPEGWPADGDGALLTASDGMRLISLDVSDATDIGGSTAPAGFFSATGILEVDGPDPVPVDGNSAISAPRPRLRVRSSGDLATGRAVGTITRPPRDGSKLRLDQNEPNPFNPVTSISFGLERAGDVSLRIYAISGRLVRTLVEEPMSPGDHQILWDGRDDAGVALPSGIYLYRIDSGGERHIRKMIMSK